MLSEEVVINTAPQGWEPGHILPLRTKQCVCEKAGGAEGGWQMGTRP